MIKKVAKRKFVEVATVVSGICPGALKRINDFNIKAMRILAKQYKLNQLRRQAYD